jgi:surfeit locus 1 family protein
VLVVAAGFVRLGFWQLARLDQRKTMNQVIEANLQAPAETLDEAVAMGEDIEYRHVTVVGSYVPEDEVLLRNRSYEGQNGFHALTPLDLGSGSTILVDRGWVPLTLDQPPVLPPPQGQVEVTGVLRLSKAPSGVGPKDPASGRLQLVFWPDMDRLASQMPGTLEPVYLELRSQTPTGVGEQPVPAPDPVLTDGPHLSYALQWFSFALIAIVGYVLLLRKQSRTTNA